MKANAKKQASKLETTASKGDAEESRPWLYAFIILLLVSIWMLTMRLTKNAFLALDFEISIVYLPTALAGIIAFKVIRKQRLNNVAP